MCAWIDPTARIGYVVRVRWRIAAHETVKQQAKEGHEQNDSPEQPSDEQHVVFSKPEVNDCGERDDFTEAHHDNLSSARMHRYRSKVKGRRWSALFSSPVDDHQRAYRVAATFGAVDGETPLGDGIGRN